MGEELQRADHSRRQFVLEALKPIRGGRPWSFAVDSYRDEEIGGTGDYCKRGNTEAVAMVGMPERCSAHRRTANDIDLPGTKLGPPFFSHNWSATTGRSLASCRSRGRTSGRAVASISKSAGGSRATMTGRAPSSRGAYGLLRPPPLTVRVLWRSERPLLRTGGCRLSRLIARRRLAYALASAAAAGAVACAVSSAAAPLGQSASLLVWSGWDIFAMSPTGKAEKPLTTGKCVASGVQWAPDRSRVYVGCLFGKRGRSVVAYAGPAGPAEPPDIHDLPVVLPYAAAFAIAPDGRIAFESRDLRIHVANADGSRQRRISSTVFHHEVGRWAGRRIARMSSSTTARSTMAPHVPGLT